MERYGSRRICVVEKIRFSITRLKRVSWRRVTLSPKRWKDKILDYEIETDGWLVKDKRSYPYSWKDKILDYEIETHVTLKRWHVKKQCSSWKDKILDYEIETTMPYWWHCWTQ